MSGSLPPVQHIDFTQLVSTGQQTNSVLTAILRVLAAGIAILPVPPIYTVADLPGTAADGQMAFASNARKPGEGVGAGTGMPVFWNSPTSTWFTTLGVVVTV